MGNPLKKPPVYLTLAQVRFNQILKLADYLPAIQERFRQAGYPDFEHQRLIVINVAMQDGQPTPVPAGLERFEFGNIEKTHVFVLETQSLTLQSTNYGQFESFSARFLEGLAIIHEALSLAFSERIGLRYLDRVMPQGGETVDQYLAREVLGLGSRLGGSPVYSFVEALNEVGRIKLMSRVAIQDGPLAFPPDIQLRNMTVAERFIAYTGQYAILDNDGFLEAREAFSASTVAEHLREIHKVIGDAFRSMVTPYALAAWDQ